MCVIFVAESVRPSPKEVRQANAANSDGIGVSWVRNGTVRWVKGINVGQAVALAAELPFPFAMHFRLATVGGKSKNLCHPFPLEADVPLKRKGETREGVLMHNGHWSGWDKVLAVARHSKEPWSDSRAAAYIVQKLGDSGILSTLPGKYVVQRPQGIEVYGGFVEVTKGLLASNLFFKYERQTTYYAKPYSFGTWEDEMESWFSGAKRSIAATDVPSAPEPGVRIHAPKIDEPGAIVISDATGQVKV